MIVKALVPCIIINRIQLLDVQFLVVYSNIIAITKHGVLISCGTLALKNEITSKTNYTQEL